MTGGCRCTKCIANAEAFQRNCARRVRYLESQMSRLIDAHALIEMDTDEQRSLHAETVATFRAALAGGPCCGDQA